MKLFSLLFALYLLPSSKANVTSSCSQSTSGYRVDSLSYFTGDSLPCMYAGNMLSSDKYENYFFFWLFPKTYSATLECSGDCPLIIYLNGGPGSTSMNALFMEGGALRVTQSGDNYSDDYKISYHPAESWAAAGDLLFIDQPVGTGWAYGEHAATSLDEIGEDFVTFLLNFYTEFPEYWDRELVLTGESFGGKYLSYAANAILSHNSEADSSEQFDLKSLILSNVLVDVPTERVEQHQLGYAIGLYDDFQVEQVEQLRKVCEEGPGRNYTADEQSAAGKAILNYITEPTGSVDQMDARYFDYEGMPDSDPFQDMFKYSNKVDTLKSELHITKPDRFSKLNSTVAEQLTDREGDSAWLYTSLISQGLQILINVGQFDMKDGVRQTLEWIKDIDFTDREQFDIQARKVYKYYD